MQECFSTGTRIAVVGKDLQHRSRNVFVLGAVKGRILDFRVEAHRPPGGAIESLDEFDFFGEGVDTKPRSREREAISINRRGPAVVVPEALDNVELPDFIKREVDDVEAAVIAGAIGIHVFDVGDGAELEVVQNDEFIVARHHEILLDIVRALSVSHRFCGHRMLRQIAARTAVRDNEPIVTGRHLRRLFRARGHKQDDKQVSQ